MIVIVAVHRSCHTVTNLANCNTIVLIGAYCICSILSSIFGFHEDWALQQPGCVFQAFAFLAMPTLISYSYLAQAISRLFFTVFSKHKYLTTYRVHWCLIALNWILGILVSTVPFFFDGSFAYEKESRLCLLTSKIFSLSMYAITIGFVIPLNSSIMIYSIIFHHARRSSRRIVPAISNTITTYIPNARREMKLAQNMIMIETFYAAAGIPLLVLILWQGIQPKNPPPEPLYLLRMNSISLFGTIMMIMLFCTNKKVKDIVLSYPYCERRRTHPVTINHYQQ
ncbi:unnamed protein product [Rotaria sp. Silwood1]|nr:unnamed protein product [Rotaria sp. Silwood1]